MPCHAKVVILSEETIKETAGWIISLTREATTELMAPPRIKPMARPTTPCSRINNTNSLIALYYRSISLKFQISLRLKICYYRAVYDNNRGNFDLFYYFSNPVLSGFFAFDICRGQDG